MTVAELIEHLRQLPQDLLVIIDMHSESQLAEHVITIEECEPREDGWVANRRPDKPTQTYVKVI